MEEAYQMPMVQNLHDNVAGRTWLTKLDTILDYYPVPVQAQMPSHGPVQA